MLTGGLYDDSSSGQAWCGLSPETGPFRMRVWRSLSRSDSQLEWTKTGGRPFELMWLDGECGPRPDREDANVALLHPLLVKSYLEIGLRSSRRGDLVDSHCWRTVP